jgi:hypothetical protein
MSNFFSRTYQRIRSESTEHLQESRETYCSHFMKSVKTSFHLVCGATAILIHGAIPAWCKQVGFRMVLREADHMENPDYPEKKHDIDRHEE